MAIPRGILGARACGLTVAVLALIGSAPLMALHLGSAAHHGLEGPDHQCDLCRAFGGNPSLVPPQPELPPLGAEALVDDAPAPAERTPALRTPRGRSPPVAALAD
jgi:hypothetical protein